VPDSLGAWRNRWIELKKKSKLCEKHGQKKIPILLPFTPKQRNATKTRYNQPTQLHFVGTTLYVPDSSIHR